MTGVRGTYDIFIYLLFRRGMSLRNFVRDRMRHSRIKTYFYSYFLISNNVVYLYYIVIYYLKNIFEQALVRMDRHIPYAQRMRRVTEVIQEVS